MHFRQDRMTSHERIEALFNRKKQDRVPIGAMSTGFNTWNAGYAVADAFEDPEKAFHGMLWTTEQYGWDPIPQYSGHTLLEILDFGGEARLPKGEFEGALVNKSHPVQKRWHLPSFRRHITSLSSILPGPPLPWRRTSPALNNSAGGWLKSRSSARP